MLQSLVIVLEPEQVPPLASLIILNRDRNWVPPPQVFVQEEKLFQLDHLQFTENISFQIY